MDLLPAARANQLSSNREQTDMGHTDESKQVVYNESHHAGVSIATGAGNRGSSMYHGNRVVNAPQTSTS